MPPKRKGTKGSGRPPKKSRPTSSPSSMTDRLEVHWGLPTTARGNDAPDTSESITRHSQHLFGRLWTELNVQEPAFNFPHIRTPVFQAKGKDLVTGGKRELSKALCDLFNVIKANTFGPQEGGLYTREALEEAFAGENEANAVIATNSTANAVLTLSTDYQIEVTVRPEGKEEESAQLIILRRLPDANPETEAATDDYAYFIKLPYGMRVTVNGHTYVNESPLQGEHTDEGSAKPFIIGPLSRFTIIELLAQPIFFFRAPEDLDFRDTKSIETESRAKPSEIERQNRSTHGDVPTDNVDITWTPLVALSAEPGTFNAGSGCSSEDETVYSDEWTDGENSPCRYLQRHVLDIQRDRFLALVPRVIAAINARQPAEAGFSIYYENRVLRPGRTWLHVMAHEGNPNHFVLLIVQVQEDRRITLHVMDPLTWKSTRQTRDGLFRDIQRVLSKSGWWTNVYGIQEEMQKTLPKVLSWAPSAQHAETVKSLTLAILAAWALALGLSPDPNFRPDSKSFFSRAHSVFQMALDETLNWKILVSFLRCTGFVRLSRQAEGNAECGPSERPQHVDPTQDRRFDLSKLPFERLLERQTSADAVDEDLTKVPVGVSIETGVAHTSDFASDHLMDEQLVRLKSLVLSPGAWNLRDTWPQLKQRLDLISKDNVPRSVKDAGTDPKSPRPAKGSHIPPTTSNGAKASSDIPPGAANSVPGAVPTNTQMDTSALESDFDACQYFTSEMSRLAADYHEQEYAQWSKPLVEQQMYAGITAVARSINEVRPISEGFSVYSHHHLRFITSARKNAESPADQVMLRYVSFDEHFILIVIQNSNEAVDQPVVYVVDPAPWLSTVRRRQTVHRRLKALPSMGAVMTESIRWFFGSGRGGVQHSRCITVLNAWAILLDLPLNLTEFTPDSSFFHDAYRLMHVVQSGKASWKLIWAFLRCRNYLSSDQPPAQDRRFIRTIPDSLVSEHQDRMNQRPDSALKRIGQTSLYRHFNVQSGYSHLDELPWDMDDTDVNTRIPTMIDYTPLLTREEVRQRYALDDPCADFRRRMNERLGDTKVVSDLRDFRDECSPTRKFDAWLLDTEVSLSIGAVTLGITKYQQKQSKNVSGGFGYLGQGLVQLCKDPEPAGTGSRVLRAGRPLLVPLHHNSHFVLLVIQLDDSARITFTIMNSMNHHLDSHSRQFIHEWARSIVMKHEWMGGALLGYPDLELPEFTTYIPVSQQPTQAECGYYVILNAWILALGLQPDSRARVDWSDDFFEDLVNLIHLTRIRKADWALIYAFLRCRRLVLRGEVPIDLRFDESYELRTDEPKYLGQFLDDQDIAEQEQFFSLPTPTTPALSIENIKATNRCKLPKGIPHTQPGAFSSDQWSHEQRAKAKKLARQQGLNMNNLTGSQLDEAFKISKTYRAQQLRRQLHKRNITVQKADATALLHETRDFIRNWDTGHTLQHESRPCPTSLDAIEFYRSILGSDALGTKLRSKCFPDFQPTRSRDNMLYSDTVNIAIAAVIEAIDRRQSEQHGNATPRIPFTGGFTLATTTQIQLGLGEPLLGRSIYRVSRSWRCFLLPFTVSELLLEEVNQWRKTKGLRIQSGQGGHQLLAVVERSNEGDGLVHVHFYDSSPARLQDAYPFLTTKLKKAMGLLGWLSPRTMPEDEDDGADAILDTVDDGLVGESEEGVNEVAGDRADHRFLHRTVTVPEQDGGWMCGAHTIINAWILALGLTPAPRLSYSIPVYEELYMLARAACSGLLSWMVLANWLRCHKLITQTSLRNVTQSRRFEFTNVWRSEADLEERIDEIVQTQDRPVLSYTETDLPYDLSNNIRHVNTPVPARAPETIRMWKEVLRKFSGLDRGYDDDDDDDNDLDWTSRHQVAHHLQEEMGSGDALHFLSDFDADAVEDTDMSDAFEAPPAVVRSKPDSLIFLDGYS